LTFLDMKPHPVCLIGAEYRWFFLFLPPYVNLSVFLVLSAQRPCSNQALLNCQYISLNSG
jgi:hypothetical protein